MNSKSIQINFMVLIMYTQIGDSGAGDCPNPKISLTPDDINQIMRPEECVALGGNCCNWACSSCNDGVGGTIFERVISISNPI